MDPQKRGEELGVCDLLDGSFAYCDGDKVKKPGQRKVVRMKQSKVRMSSLQ